MTALPSPGRWQRVAPILEQALDLPPRERAAFLDRASGGDLALRAEVEALLNADAAAGAFLESPVDLEDLAGPAGDEAPGEEAPAAAGPGPGPAAGTAIGPYRVVREIGRGGMGVVYEAEQQQPRRPVALKVILGGRHVDADAVRMFRREADSLARLKHPAIASIYESGCTEEGQHFFAMELVQGRTLSEHLERDPAPATQADLRRRLLLFRKIAAAVAYAHQRGVIHRDLKPSNILVLDPPGAAAGGAVRSGGAGQAGDVPEVKILDFGLARIADPDAEQATALTAIGRIQGTLPYMSPEQVRGRHDEIDVRTDVYSLGVILYRLLAGRLPYAVEGASFPEAARIVCEQPPRPLRVAAGGRLRIDRDLAIIAARALEKEPARRYPTVDALDEDVARHLAGQPILARPASAAYQIRKLMARHKAPFAAAVLALAALVGFAALTTVQSRRIAAERDRAGREAATAERVTEFLTSLFKVADPRQSRGNTITAREILDRGVETIGRELADEPEVKARLMLTMGQVYLNLGLYDRAAPPLEQAVEDRRRLFGAEHPETLAAMQSLAYQRAQAGRLDEARDLHEQALATSRRVLGEDHPGTLVAASNLARVYRALGRYADAEAIDRQVLDARRRVRGEDHPDTLSSMIGLGQDLSRQRRYPEAEAVLAPALEKLRRVQGEDDMVTLGCQDLLAYVIGRQGRAAEAEPLHRDSLERHRRVLGDDHPLTLQAEETLANLFDRQKRYAEAEPLYRDVLERRRRVLGADHQETLGSIPNLANMLSVEGRYAEAEALLRQALAAQSRLLGDDHPDTVSTLYNLGCMAALKGDRAAALDWLGRAVTHGWAYADQMAGDGDLEILRGDPAFTALVERARRNRSG